MANLKAEPLWVAVEADGKVPCSFTTMGGDEVTSNCIHPEHEDAAKVWEQLAAQAGVNQQQIRLVLPDVRVLPTLGDGVSLTKMLSLAERPSKSCLLYTSPSPRDGLLSRMPSSA